MCSVTLVGREQTKNLLVCESPASGGCHAFFPSCEQQEGPELRGQPVIVVPTMAETTCAIAASYPAKAFGINTGTPRA